MIPIKFSCIIPVHNEAERIQGVLDVVKIHPSVEEIIVVNDGSTDHLNIKSGNKVLCISHKTNQGKTKALQTGLEKAKNEWVITLDSDLLYLKKENISALIKPIEEQKAEMSTALFKNSLWLFRMIGLDIPGGQRAFNKKLIPDINALGKLPRYGFEVYLNGLLAEKKAPLAVVKWDNVIAPRKSAKRGYTAGTIGDLKMIANIIATHRLSVLLRQTVQLLKLRVKHE